VLNLQPCLDLWRGLWRCRDASSSSSSGGKRRLRGRHIVQLAAAVALASVLEMRRSGGGLFCAPRQSMERRRSRGSEGNGWPR
jgi:hypothetical protein